MVFNLRPGLARECLEVRIRPVLDLVLEERRVALLILNLAMHIVTFEYDAVLGVQRSDNRVVRAVQRCPRHDSLALQDRIQCVDDRYVRGHHQMGVVADRSVSGTFFTQTSGVHLERRAEIRLGDELVIDRTEHRRCPGRVRCGTGVLCIGYIGRDDERQQGKANAQARIVPH